MLNEKFGELKTQAAKINSDEARQLFVDFMVKAIACEMLRLDKDRANAALLLRLEEDLLVMRFE